MLSSSPQSRGWDVSPLVRQLLGYFTGLLARAAETISKLALYLIAGHLLGAHQAGLFFLCLTWVSLGTTITRMGLDRAVTRHIAAELAVGAGAAARAALFMALRWTVLSGLAGAAMTAGGAYTVSGFVFHSPDLARPLLLAALSMLPQTMVFTIGSALVGLKRGTAAQITQNALWPTLTLLALLLGVGSVAGLLIAMAAALSISCLLGLGLIWRERRRFHCVPTADVPALPSLWATARPLAAVEITQVALTTLPVLALGMAAPPDIVGAFSMANRFSMLIWVIILSIGTFAGPRFAELHRRGDLVALRKYNFHISLGTALIAGPAALVLMIAPGFLLHLIVPEFTVANTALRLLALGQLINCLFPSQDLLLSMTGHGGALRRLNFLQIGTALCLGGILIPLWGMNGAALTVCITVAQGALGTAWTARRLIFRPDSAAA